MADSEAQPNHATGNNPSKYYNHFLFKAIIVTIFLVVLPLFPSQAPESINQTLHTRSWEILQLIFVGIAVSYGLFSRKSDEIIDKENGSATTKFDNAQSYVSRLLQVSSVFGDESEDASVFDDNNNSSDNNNSNKVIQTWNNQYHRGETESHVLEEQRSVSVKTSKVGEKPLLLPVRSLKSRVAEPDLVEQEENMKSGAVNNKSKSSSSKSMEENVVLPSPIPWRSRSGRIELKEESTLFSSSSSMAEDPEFNKLEPRSFRSQSFRSSSSRPNSTSPSPNKLSPSPAPSPSPAFSSPKKPSPSPESSQVRILEEMARKKTPAPPPPPPHFLGKSSSMKSSSSEKELRRSVRSVPAEIPDEVKGEAGKSVRTFTPFNGRGRSYGIEKAKENLVKKEGGLVTEESEDSEVEEEDDFFDENAAMVGRDHNSVVADDNGSEYNSGDGGPDVDKKADEFIAKFREQIRLQRIESIRRSAGQAAARNQLVR